MNYDYSMKEILKAQRCLEFLSDYGFIDGYEHRDVIRRLREDLEEIRDNNLVML